LSPIADWCQYDSTVATARSSFGGNPHFRAAHWMISSVVPRNLPSTNRAYGISLRARHRRSSSRPGTVWFALRLSGRGSQRER
jgi:hypothetical protein